MSLRILSGTAPAATAFSTPKGMSSKRLGRQRSAGSYSTSGTEAAASRLRRRNARWRRAFFPDTISSDLHIGNVDGPVYDLLTTLSKFLHLGMMTRRGHTSRHRSAGEGHRKVRKAGNAQAGRGRRRNNLQARRGTVRTERCRTTAGREGDTSFDPRQDDQVRARAPSVSGLMLATS